MEGQTFKVKGVVDLVLIVDITGSMQHCIDELRVNLEDFVKWMTEPGPNNNAPVTDWRIKVIGYRDVFADSRPLEDYPFTNDLRQVKANLQALKAEGGDDEPESLLDALYYVANIGETERDEAPRPDRWRKRHTAKRAVVIFTDATYHNKMKNGGDLGDVMHACMANGLYVAVFAPDAECYDEMTQMSGLDLESYPYDRTDLHGAARALREITKDRKRFRRTLESLAKTVSRPAMPPPVL